jgi:ribosomal protein L5
MNRYHYHYNTKIRLILLTKYNYKNIYELDNISRIDLSLLVKDSKNLISSLSALLILTNKSLLSYKTSSSGNLYKGDNQKSTLLRATNYRLDIFTFIENLLNYYLPRIRYFKGFPSNSISKSGNFSFIFKDLMVFPQLEEELEIFYKLRDLRLDIVWGKNLKVNHLFFYRLLGFNFIR